MIVTISFSSMCVLYMRTIHAKGSVMNDDVCRLECFESNAPAHPCGRKRSAINARNASSFKKARSMYDSGSISSIGSAQLSAPEDAAMDSCRSLQLVCLSLCNVPKLQVLCTLLHARAWECMARML